MILNESIPTQLDAIKRRVQQDGRPIEQGPEGGWEFCGAGQSFTTTTITPGTVTRSSGTRIARTRQS